MKLSALALVILTSYNLAGSSSCHDGLDDGCLWCFSLESQTYLQPDTQVPKSKTEAVLVIPLKSRHSRPSCRGHRPSALWPVACAGREGGREAAKKACAQTGSGGLLPSLPAAARASLDEQQPPPRLLARQRGAAFLLFPSWPGRSRN